MNLLEKIKAQGWYLTEEGIKKLTKEVLTEDADKLIKQALNWDLRDVGAGALPNKPDANGFIDGRIVLQLQKIRNISAPKNHEESTAAPRFLQLELTDGFNTVQSLELERINFINMNIPPGTKLYLKPDKLQLMQGFLMLKPTDIEILGGNVENLVEKWEVARQMQKYSRGGTRMLVGANGPPPWIAFGKRLDSHKDALNQDRNFKSLQAANDKDKTSKENEEFNTMRNEAIAEAAKAGSKKVFGGGQQNILDYNVKKILDKGYSEEEAKVALKITNNNLERALYNLKRGKDRNHNNAESNIRSENIGVGGGRRQRGGSRINSTKDESSITAKPAANVSLFDFLTNKLPGASDATVTVSTNSTNTITRNSNGGTGTGNDDTEIPLQNQKLQQQQQQQRAQQNQKAHVDKVKFENNMSASFAANRSSTTATTQQISSYNRQPNNDRNRRPNKEDRRKNNSNHNNNTNNNNNNNQYSTNFNQRTERSSKRDVEQMTRSATSSISQSGAQTHNNKRNNDYKQYNNINNLSKQHQRERPNKRSIHQDIKQGGGGGSSIINNSNNTSSNNNGNNKNNNADNQMENLIESTTKMRISNRKESYHQSSNNSNNNNNSNKLESGNQRRHQPSKQHISTTTATAMKLQPPQKQLQTLKINALNVNTNNNNSNNNTNQMMYINTQQFVAKTQTIIPTATVTAVVTTTIAGAPSTPIMSNPQPAGFVNQLCNGLPYDPSKIMGFQSKEANEYAMNLLKSQGVTLTPTETPPVSNSCQQQQQQQSLNVATASTVSQPLPLPLPPPPVSALVAAPQILNVTTTAAYVTNAGIPAFANLAATQPPPALPPPPPLPTTIPYEVTPGANWPWKKGDLCLAKYWEDCKFYEAEVTDITDKTCVVLFRGYGNFEEVLKSDCLPITDAHQRTVNTYETNLTVMTAANAMSLTQQQQHSTGDSTTIAVSGAPMMASTHQQQHQPFQRHNSHHRYRSERQMYVPPHKRSTNN